MHEDMKRIGNTIKNVRLSQELTQEALAEKVNTTNRTVMDIENGQRNPTFETMFKIIQTLNIPADLIFRPGDLSHTPEQEQFFAEYLDANEQEQRLSMAASRSIWRELRGDSRQQQRGNTGKTSKKRRNPM